MAVLYTSTLASIGRVSNLKNNPSPHPGWFDENGRTSGGADDLTGALSDGRPRLRAIQAVLQTAVPKVNPYSFQAGHSLGFRCRAIRAGAPSQLSSAIAVCTRFCE